MTAGFQTPEGFIGYRALRDARGNIDSIQSSWEQAELQNDRSNRLTHIMRMRQNHSSEVVFEQSAIRRFSNFGGATTRFQYDANANLSSITHPNALEAKFEYDENDRLAAVDLGSKRHIHAHYDERGSLSGYSWTKTE